MFSPALRHRQRILAEQAGTAAPEATGPAEPSADTPAGQEYAGLRVLLHDNLRTLSDIQSIEARNPKKREMAAAFAPWIEGVLAADQPVQDEIVTTNLIWAIDYRDFDYALRLARFVIAHGLALPERYKRTPACFLAEDVSNIALAQFEAVTLEQLLMVEALVEGADMTDIVMARLHKAIGRAFVRRAETIDPASENAPAGIKAACIEEAGKHLRRAAELDANVGVKKDLEKVARLIKAAQEQAK